MPSSACNKNAPSGRAFTESEIVFKHVIITRRYGDIIWAFSVDEEQAADQIVF
ncbi:hypothetical protein KP2269_51640 [Klebsiella pneumoniae]|nr:hypothetical protein KP2269_51640 [Klebsiella pneumoniae]